MKRFNFFLISAVLFFIFIPLAFLAKSHAYFSIDLKVASFIQSLSFPYLKNLMIFISFPGYGIQKYIIPLIIASVLFFLGKKKESIFLIYIFLSAELLNLIIKHFIGRIRPESDLLHYIYKVEDSASFPSGHVMFYTVLFGFLFFLIWKFVERKKLKIILNTVCLFFILTIGISRIYLGAHWFSDVIGAYLIGFSWLFLSIFVYNAWSNEKSKDKTNI